MWFGAADSSAVDAALVTAVWAFLGIVVTTLGNFAVQSIRSRRDSATASPTPVDSSGTGTALIALAKDIGQLDERANDSDQRDDLQDRTLHNHGDRIEALERWAEHHDPNWRG